jgi:N-acetylglucosaminyldiphosphoundecaprenol N-acetyl-beta-D-mannosaminyltransferase
MRLHSLIFAAKMKVPFVGLVYDPKVRSLANKLQMDSYTCEISNLESLDLLNRVDRLWENRSEIKRLLNKNVNILEMEAKDKMKIIINEIEKKVKDN